MDLSQVGDPHAIAGLLKMYLRSLPEPLLPFDFYDKFLQVQRNPQDPDYLSKLVKLVHSLPQENL